jgi:ribonuclease PH
MALIDAGIPMIDYVCASTAGCIDKQPVLGKAMQSIIGKLLTTILANMFHRSQLS